MMEGVVLRFSTTWWPDSDLIRWRTDCKVSHVEFESPNLWTLGSRLWGGVLCRPPSASSQHRVIRATFPGIEKAYDWMVYNRVGYPYDRLGILGVATAANWRNKSGRFCSEAILESAVAVGVHLLSEEVLQWQITPRDLLLSPLVTILSGPKAFLRFQPKENNAVQIR